MAGFSLDMQEFIVDLHNDLRDKHETDRFSVFHSGLSELTWNDELATIAQRWADQCKFGNDGNRATMDGSSVVVSALRQASHCNRTTCITCTLSVVS